MAGMKYPGIKMRSKNDGIQIPTANWSSACSVYLVREFALSLTTTPSPIYTSCITRELLQRGNDNVIYANEKVRSGDRYLLYTMVIIKNKK
jgi:hypothetical protein